MSGTYNKTNSGRTAPKPRETPIKLDANLMQDCIDIGGLWLRRYRSELIAESKAIEKKLDSIEKEVKSEKSRGKTEKDLDHFELMKRLMRLRHEFRATRDKMEWLDKDEKRLDAGSKAITQAQQSLNTSTARTAKADLE